MAIDGPLSPGTLVDDAAYGVVIWSNPGNAISSNNSYATAALAIGTTPSHYLKATNFGFAIPAGATIDGIIVEIEKSKAGSGECDDDRIRIVKADGTVGATDKSAAGNWGGDTYVTHGSATELWGESWTAANINDADFGVVVAAKRVSGTSVSARVDHIRITIHYTEGGGGTTHNAAAVVSGVATVAAAAAAVYAAQAAVSGLSGPIAAASMVLAAAAVMNGAGTVTVAATLEGEDQPPPSGPEVPDHRSNFNFRAGQRR